MSMATSDVTVVPQTNASTPNVGLPPPGGLGTHAVLVNSRYSPARASTGQASQNSTPTSPATSARMPTPAARVSPWNRTSGTDDGTGGAGVGVMASAERGVR